MRQLIAAILTQPNIMIRNIQSKSEENSSDSLHFKKELAAVSIRKSNRQSIFNKRRFPQRQSQLTYEEDYSSDEEEESQPSGIIIDKELQNELKKIMAKHYTLEQLPELVQSLQSEEILQLYEAVIGIRKLFICKDPPIEKVLALKADARLIQLVKHYSPQVQMESSWILTNIACGTSGECNILIKNGIIPAFILAISSDYREVVEQAVWGLRNIACDSGKIRKMIAQAGGLQLLQILTSKFDDETMLDWTCSAMAAVCRDLPLPTIKTAIHLMCCMLACNCITNNQTIQECLLAISQYCGDDDITEESMDSLLKTNIQVKLVELIAQHKSGVAELRQEDDIFLTFECLQIIRKMLYANIRSVDVFQELKILDSAEMMIQDPDPRIKIAMISILTDFVLRSEDCFNIILAKDGFFTDLIEMLMVKDVDWDVKLKLFAFFQSVGENCGDFQVQQFYTETEIMQMGVQLLKSEQEATILQMLNHISAMLIRSEQHDKEQLMCNEFQKKNGVIMLSRLVHHPNKDIQYKSHSILSRFYDTDSLNIFV